MGLTDDLTRLHDLHRSGALTDSEYEAAKARVIAAAAEPAGHCAGAGAGAQAAAAVNALRRPQADRWVGGVCVGLAAATGLDAWVWRLLFVLLALWGGAGLLLYVLLWVFVPEERATATGTPGVRG